jgi:adenylate cyclase
MKESQRGTGRLGKRIALFFKFLVPVAIFFGWSLTGPGETSELAWRDFLYTIRGVRPAPDEVVVVAIDEPSFQEIGLHWPWPRSLHGLVIEKLHRAGAEAVALDILFVEPSADPGSDEALAAAARNAGNVVFGAHISQVTRRSYKQSMLVEPLPILAEAAREVAIVSLFPDPDGIMRKGVTFLEGMPSLAFAATAVSDPSFPEREPEEFGSFLIDFTGPSGNITTVSYYQVLTDEVPAELFEGKIVLVGLASDVAVEVEGAVDAYPTPFFRFSRKMMYGVEIHANAVATLLEGCPLRVASQPWLVPLLLAVAFVPFPVRKRPVVLTALTLGCIAVLAGISVFLFQAHDLVLDALPAMGAVLGSGMWWGVTEYTATAREKRQLRGVLDRYVAPDVVKAVMRNPELLRLGGEKRELSVLFADIRGFTNLSELLEPEQLVSLLNAFHSRMTDYVFAHGGTLDKYIGDAIMAIFGAPLPRANHARCACRTTLDMLTALEDLGPDWEARGVPPPRIGVGVNTGIMVVGNMGSDKRFDYTVMGDEVNLTSRLEGLCKVYLTAAIISESTRSALEEDFVCRELDLVRVKGKKRPVKIYELLAEGDVSDQWKAVLRQFSRGLAAYRSQSWKEARAAFREVLQIRPEDGPAKVFLSRCELLGESPPGSDWDGVWTMVSK